MLLDSGESHAKLDTSCANDDAAAEDAGTDNSTMPVPAQKPGSWHLLKTLTQGDQYSGIHAHVDADELDPSAAVSYSLTSSTEYPFRHYHSQKLSLSADPWAMSIGEESDK
jgi:hypothetical protein